MEENESKKMSPVTAVINTVKKFLVTNREFESILQKIKGNENFVSFYQSDDFKNIEKIKEELHGELDELLDTLSNLFDEYSALLEKSADAKEDTK